MMSLDLRKFHKETNYAFPWKLSIITLKNCWLGSLVSVRYVDAS